MLLSSIKRTDPEQIFAIMKNAHSATLVHGDCVTHVTGASADGVSVVQSAATATLLTVCGIVDANVNGIAVGEYGRVQVYGYHAAAKAGAGTNAGLAIKTFATAGTIGPGAVGDDPVAQIGICLTTVSGGVAPVWLRCM